MKRDNQFHSKDGKFEPEAAAKEFEALAKANQAGSKLAMYGLVSVFIFSMFVFVLSRLLPTALPEIGDTTELFGASLQRIESLQQQIDQLDEAVLALGPRESWDSGDVAENIALVARKDSALSKLQDAKSELETVREARRSDLIAVSKETFWQRLILLSVTSIGAVLLSVFMIQILISFFKYFIRMANYYSTKAAIIRSLNNDDYPTLAAVLQATTSETIHFGKDPDAPLDKLIDLLKAAKS